jgi:hypothetical protein
MINEIIVNQMRLFHAKIINLKISSTSLTKIIDKQFEINFQLNDENQPMYTKMRLFI